MDTNNIKPYPGPHSSHAKIDTNKLRAAVLGANDGIVSTASLVVGVAGATQSSMQVITAGIAGLVAGAISMGVGEYVSVSSQRDTEKAQIKKEKQLIADYPDEEMAELSLLYQTKGLKQSTAEIVAKELTNNDVHAAHFDAELGIDPESLTNPWHAAIASSLAFTAGAVIPLVSIIASAHFHRVAVTFAAVIISLFITGLMSAKASGASVTRSSSRVVLGGMIAMTVTYLIGAFIGLLYH